jgi:hypothetical protein
MNTDHKGNDMDTTTDARAAAHRQRALDALATLTTSDLLAIADALDIAAKADARDVAAAETRAVKAGRRRWSDGSYSGEHASTRIKRDRASHMARAREVMTTAISGTFLAERD